MPLIQGKSQKSFGKNVRTEMHAGKPRAQSLAIAYSLKKKADEKKMFEGGPVGSYNEDQQKMGMRHSFDETEKETDYQETPDRDAPYKESMMHKQFAEGGMIEEDEKKTGYLDMPHESPRYDSMAMEEDDKDLNQHGQRDMGPTGSTPEPKSHTKHDSYLDMLDDQDLNQYGEQDPGGSVPYAMFAPGGIVERIMNRRAEDQMKPVKMSEGGRVANDTPIEAGFESNDYDDLANRDDLESTYGEDDNAGDSLDNQRENQDRQDIVERIIRQRSMKRNRNPVPA